MTVAVVVATFGDLDTWAPLADRAVASVHRQTHPVDAVARVHGDTLAAARNDGALVKPDADWLIFLDADDELDDRYVEAMLAGAGDVRQPSTIGVHPDGTVDDHPNVIPPRGASLLVGNHIVVGAMQRASLFHQVGGFRDLPALEDWDLWLRMEEAGATFGVVADAVYRIHVTPASRNQQHRNAMLAAHRRVRRDAEARRRHVR